MRKSFIKIISILVIIALNWSGFSAVIETISYYLDNEGDGGNTFTAATLDFSLASGSWSLYPTDPLGLLPGDTVSKTITVNNLGTLGFKYNVTAVKTSGSDNFCDALDVVAKRDNVEMYSDALSDLTITPPVVYESSLIDVWSFEVSLPSDESFYPMETCGFKFVFTGWQEDLPTASTGFSDIEEDANTLMGALGQACDPDGVDLPSDFDQAYWIDKANDGGVVEGSFVFPSNTTGLQLGPTEIMGDLIFGQNNTATIKGPIYVHGDLEIASGTTITQHNTFGNNFAVIIVDGTITISDDVEFVGTAAGGAFLLVSTKASGTVIDIQDGTLANGNLGDAVLFATLGNIHIGDNRTVLDAYVVTEGSSGDTGFLSPSSSANVSFSGADDSWTNPDNNQSLNDQYATATIGSSSDVTYYLQATNFNFNISSGATINGIEVNIENHATCVGSCTSDIRDYRVRLVQSGTIGSTDRADTSTYWPASDGTATYGSSSDLWQGGWTVTNINDASTGVVLSATRTSGGDKTAYVDHIAMKVYWSIAGQTIDNEGTILDGTIPTEAACGPQFMDLGDVVINEFVPNTPDTGISATIFSDGFGTGFTDYSFDEAPVWTEGGNGGEKRAAGSGQDTASPDGDRFAALYNTGSDGSICTPISTAGYSSLNLKYYWRGDPDAEIVPSMGPDDGLVQYASSGTCASASWTTAATHPLDAGNNDIDEGWSALQSLGLPDGVTLVRFIFSGAGDGGSGTEQFRVDGVTITGEISAGSYSTGIMSPFANATGTGDGWNNPTNAYADGGTPPATDDDGDKHQYYNFGFGIPSSATIDGIEVSADAWATMSITNTGLLPPSANINSGWTDPGNAYSSDDSRASATSDSSNDVQYYNFGLPTIPAGSTINGIEVQVEGYRNNNRQAQVSLSWNNGVSYTTGSGTGVKTTNVPYDNSSPYTDGTSILGGSSDTWGIAHTWSPGDFINANFRVKLNENDADWTLYVDQVQVKVYYTPPSSSCQLGVDLSWNGGSSWTGEKLQTLTGTEATYTLGSSSDNWGHTWTPAEINSNFRARVHSCTGGPTTNLDWLRAKVYYTVSGGENEWVELYNGTDSAVDVDGWALYDAEDTHELIISDANTDTGDTIIPSGGYLVVYRDGDADFDLDNTTDWVRLYDDQITDSGELVDSYNYDYGGPIPENKSFARVPDGTANWVDPEPTPGRPNNMFVVPYVEEIEEELTEEELTEEEIIEEEEPIEEEEIIEENEEEEIIPEEEEEGLIDEIVDEIVEEILPETEPIDEEQISEEQTATEETPIPSIEDGATGQVIEESAPATETETISAPENNSIDNSASDSSSVSENSGGESSNSDTGAAGADTGSTSADSGASADSGSAAAGGDSVSQ